LIDCPVHQMASRDDSEQRADGRPPGTTGDNVGRGGLKLEAAVQRFGLGARLRGARAVDVGASTGGFTEVLLRHGAAHVTAVDVGHGQLHRSLRRDARVTSLEGVDWKTLSLSQAEGPFDAFTVDVSFVAARNMLRGLAFRLRAGAEGVVLVKPQFELPDRMVKAGDVTDPALRARALARFTDKATALGFTVMETIDSPVAGGSGTVEILAHLRFDGRPAALPAPGERRGQPSRAPARTARGNETLTWFAVAAPGLEEAVEAEVTADVPEATGVTRVPGGVEWTGPLAAGLRANLALRVASRVLLRLGQVEARTFPELRRRLRALPWDRALVGGEGAVRVEAAASRCRLYHTGALAETLLLAAGDHLRSPLRPAPKGPDEAAPVTPRLFIRGQEDRFTVSVDSSGELLHRRGWRVETGRAPLRETLAAGILWLSGHRPEEPFVDPMCGAGTIALEACARALRVAPGLARSFAFERWPSFEPALWDRLRDEALAVIRPGLPAPIFAFDRDAGAVEITRRNAGRAGFLPHLVVECAALEDRAAPADSGLLVLNPPYGRRLAGGGGAGRELRQALRARYPGWRIGLLAPPGQAGRALGVPAHATHRLTNGGLRVELLVAALPSAHPRRAGLVQ
jgi:putative N6-adenine-specific DNA methylase